MPTIKQLTALEQVLSKIKQGDYESADILARQNGIGLDFEQEPKTLVLLSAEEALNNSQTRVRDIEEKEFGECLDYMMTQIKQAIACGETEARFSFENMHRYSGRMLTSRDPNTPRHWIGALKHLQKNGYQIDRFPKLEDVKERSTWVGWGSKSRTIKDRLKAVNFKSIYNILKKDIF